MKSLNLRSEATEDWEFLEKILDNDREALNFDLCKVSAILKLISVSTL